MVRLLNSSMMPKAGIYSMESITVAQFCDILVDAYENQKLDSYIGYQQNADLIEKLTGIRPAINRNNTILENGDTILIMKLGYRANNKRGQVDENDFEFFEASYQER